MEKNKSSGWILEVRLRNIVVMILACAGIKAGFSGKFLESLPRRTKLSRDLTVIKENRAERVGVRLFDFDDSSVAKERAGRVGNNTPYHSVARRILFIPGWYACSLASSTEYPSFQPSTSSSPLRHPRGGPHHVARQFSTRMVANTAGSL